jgi:hypothetical protein
MGVNSKMAFPIQPEMISITDTVKVAPLTYEHIIQMAEQNVKEESLPHLTAQNYHYALAVCARPGDDPDNIEYGSHIKFGRNESFSNMKGSLTRLRSLNPRFPGEQDFHVVGAVPVGKYGIIAETLLLNKLYRQTHSGEIFKANRTIIDIVKEMQKVSIDIPSIIWPVRRTICSHA